MTRMKKVFGVIIVLIVMLAGIVLWEAHRSATTLITTEYDIPEEIGHEIRIVLLSDLHNYEFGEQNAELIRAVKNSTPDLIFMVGDMLNDNEEDSSVMENLIRDCADIAPVYFSYGNHEKQWEKSYHKSIREIAQNAGAKVLEHEYLDTDVKKEAVRIGGYYGYYRAPVMETSDPDKKKQDIAWCDEFEDTNRLKLLLCHIPTSFLDWEHRDEYEAGLAFCGHYHAGQVLFPGGRGLFAPYVGWFPRYTRGVFAGDGTDVVLTAGLGNHKIPRLNNPGELVLIRLVPEE